MRIILIFIVIIPLFCFSQKDTSKFINNFYLELNPGVSRLTYTEQYEAKGKFYYSEVKENLLNFDIDFLFRNKYFRIGFSSNVLLIFDLRLKGGVNALMNYSNNNHYLGPYYSYGYFLKENNFLYGVTSGNTFGIEYYYKKVHFDLGYSKYITKDGSDYIKNASSINLNIGYAFNLESFRKKK